MANPTEVSFNDLVERFLGRRLPESMASAVSIPDLSPEAGRFIRRMLSLMSRARYRTTDFNPALIRWLAQQVPSILPAAWGGRIPPITLPGRHGKLDAWVARKRRFRGRNHCVFVDVGCGFPPVTAAETARFFPDWDVYGVDVSFADYVVYDADGNYACFNANGDFQYFQGLTTQSGRELYADAQAARANFETLFEALLPLLPEADGDRSRMAGKNGGRLIQNHIRDFDSPNLRFLKAGMECPNTPPADVMRCMNLLIYFSPEERKRMLSTAGKFLNEDGLLIAGTNGLGIQCRYAVYGKSAEGAIADQFVFGLDNLGPISFMPWFSIHEDDPEASLLADLAGAIRSDAEFWPRFERRVDQLLDSMLGLPRGPEGFLRFPPEPPPMKEYLKANARIWGRMQEEGFGEGAAEALGRAGRDARVNSAGDIAVRLGRDSGL